MDGWINHLMSGYFGVVATISLSVIVIYLIEKWALSSFGHRRGHVPSKPWPRSHSSSLPQCRSLSLPPGCMPPPPPPPPRPGSRSNSAVQISPKVQPQSHPSPDFADLLMADYAGGDGGVAYSGFIVSSRPNLTQGEIDRLQRLWRETYKGLPNPVEAKEDNLFDIEDGKIVPRKPRSINMKGEKNGISK